MTDNPSKTAVRDLAVQALVEALREADIDLEGALLAHVAAKNFAMATCVEVTREKIAKALAAYEATHLGDATRYMPKPILPGHPSHEEEN